MVIRLMSADNQLIEGCRANNRKAQKAIFEKYKNSMLGVCMRYCKSKDEAEDVLMEAFMTVFSEIHSFRGEGSFEYWIKRIMINSSINNYRKNLKHYFHTDIDDIDDRKMVKNENIEVSSVKDIMKVVQKLPEGYRVVFNLYAIEGYKHKEIAKMLEITVGTSKSQLSKARKMLQSKISI
jgi:RNA polymerase sigma-70 factor (ECF subfamily)